jgi:FAD/FMN-containing dehydrogenase
MKRNWKNWAGNLHCACEVVAPRGLEELCQIVKRAVESGRRIRATGASYSWAPLVPNDDLIIRMHQLKAVLDVNESAGTIEVECGMTIDGLTRAAAKHGRTVVSPTLFPKPTIGGAIAVGAHGTDRNNGGMQDAVVALKIVDAEGKVRIVRDGDPDMQAARVALGTFGVIYSATFALPAQYDVATEICVLPVDLVLDEFEDLQQCCGFLEMFWFPFQRNMWVYMMNDAKAPRDQSSWWSRFKTRVNTAIQSVASQRLIPTIARHAPRLTPVLNSLASRMAFHAGYSVRTASKAFHFQRAYAKCWEMEYAVPKEKAARVWRDGIDLVDHYAATGCYPMNLALHGRFTGASKSWIAPNYGRPTCYIDVTTAKGTPHWYSFFCEVERRWCDIEGARPHWGKLFFQEDRVREQYSQMKPFLDVRESWDPKRVFLNRYLEKQIFQLPPVAGSA